MRPRPAQLEGQHALERGPIERPAVRGGHVLDRQLEQQAQAFDDLLQRHVRAEPPGIDLEPLTEVDERVPRDDGAML